MAAGVFEIGDVMIGVKGEPFTDSFDWVKWRRSEKELRELGADRILTDEQASDEGFVVRAAKSFYLGQKNGRQTLNRD